MKKWKEEKGSNNRDGQETDYEIMGDRQKALRLMEALSQVDEELLARSEDAGYMVGAASGEEAENAAPARRIPFWKYGRLLAACFVFAVLGACAFGMYTSVVWKGAGATNSGGFNANGAPPLEGYSCDAAVPEEAHAAENAGSADVTQAVMGEDTIDLNGQADGSAGRNGESDKMAEKTDGVSSQAGQSSENTDGSPREMEREQQLAQSALEQGENTEKEMTDFDKAENPQREITLEEARANETMGKYVPTAIPAGYRLESVRESSEDRSDRSLSLCWIRGMDDIRLYITDYYAIAKPPQGGDELAVVDLAKPETYDVHLYEIPYGETVPSEYREMFDDPVFKASDLTLAVVEARMKSVADSGDTDTPRGNFSVLYDSGILVRFNGRGTAEEIWELFQSVNP